MRHRHDVHVSKLGTGFPPIAMRQDVVTPNFSAGLQFAAGRHRPVEKRVETRHAGPGSRWLHMLEKSREPTDYFARSQFSRDRAKLMQAHPGFTRSLCPRVGLDFR